MDFTSYCILDLGLKIDFFTYRSSAFTFRPLQLSTSKQCGPRSRGSTAAGELVWGEVRGR
jgi:hypothetical protein